MRFFGALLILLLTVVCAAAQSSTAPSGAAGKPAAQGNKFRKPGVRPPTLRAHAAVRNSRPATQAETGPRVEERTSHTTVAAARKRGATSQAPTRSAPGALADRLTTQLDLAWTGDYTGLIKGEANEKTTAAIKSFQKNRKFKETGILNTQERALLAASARAKQAQVGWTMLDDRVSGARIGIPTKQVPNKVQNKSGTRWSSAQGQVQVETFRIREPGTTLASVYEQQKREPATRRLELNLWRGDFFVLSGMQGLKKFYVRAEFKDGEVRGMTVLYDQATENILDPVAVVMANAFTAFPSATGSAQLGSASQRKVEYGTGIIVSGAGHILTDRQLTDGCNVLVVSGYGDASREAEDKAAGLALLRVYGVSDLAPATFVDGSANAPDVTVLGVADPQNQDGGSAISSVAARVRGEALEPAPQTGFSGAAVLDAQSRFVGMVELKAPVLATIGALGAQPQASNVPAAEIRAFLDAQKVSTASSRSGLDSAKAAIVRVICVRK